MKLKDGLLPSQDLLERPLRPLPTVCDITRRRSMCKIARKCGRQLLVGSVHFLNHASITPLTALSRDGCSLKWMSPVMGNFGLWLTRVLPRWIAVGMDSGLAIIHNTIINACVLIQGVFSARCRRVSIRGDQHRPNNRSGTITSGCKWAWGLIGVGVVLGLNLDIQL